MAPIRATHCTPRSPHCPTSRSGSGAMPPNAKHVANCHSKVSRSFAAPPSACCGCENTTVLRRDGEHHRVTGRKYYSTGTAFADFARINVESEQGDPLALIIPVARDGVQVLDDWDGMGQRMTASGSLLLHDVQVFADEIAARDGSTLVGRHCGALRQLHLVATAAGIVRNVVADARRYVLAHGRPVLHSPAPTARDDHFIQQIPDRRTRVLIPLRPQPTSRKTS
ncbi:acyl-CoA dehydrogenase [Burkholderia humptydooensis]|uniref:Acyl-CoA dehydrogenase n=2 Tax=Burkholderia humptydooensis TaxID=430531 RepID=A0A7U4PB51_9BURK|nr:acyl-CoA dehydrogenase [Burkholderia humptydooensis]EIP84660.1 Acyl-CoA dehydrogenase-like protein [Burkholderia humptydooensis MSMB43]QPS47818.1 acyl-CoA dehydrogenase [Burkholderia humptydooensis]